MLLRRLRYWKESARRSDALREEMELHLAEKSKFPTKMFFTL